jgi:uncharacterized protein (TIGR02246 family)
VTGLDDLLASEAVRDTIARYAHAFDGGRADEAAGCFTEDGALTVGGGSPAVGRATIAERFAAAAARLAAAGDGAFVHHQVSSIHVDVDVAAGNAIARSYFLVVTESGPDHWGRYLDRLVPAGDGRWLLAERSVQINGRTRPSRLT